MIKLFIATVFISSFACKQRTIEQANLRSIDRRSVDSTPLQSVEAEFSASEVQDKQEVFSIFNQFTEESLSLSAGTPMDESSKFQQLERPLIEKSIATIAAQRSYPLDETPAIGTVEITLDDKPLDNDKYQTVDQTVVLNFDPLENQDLRVRYRQNSPLISSFPLDPRLIDGSIQLLYNDKPQQEDAYKLDDKVLIFTPPPADKVDVLIRYKILMASDRSILSEYSPTQYIDLKVLDAVSKEEISFATNDDKVFLMEEDFQVGRQILIRYKSPDDIKKSISLDGEPITGSFKSSWDNSKCQRGEGLSINGKNINIQCEFDGKLDLMVSYQYQVPRKEVSLPSIQNSEDGYWQLSIDGKSSANWQRQGHTIKLPDGIDPNATIIVRFIRAKRTTGASRAR